MYTTLLIIWAISVIILELYTIKIWKDYLHGRL
jgi:hypothetical protein